MVDKVAWVVRTKNLEEFPLYYYYIFSNIPPGRTDDSWSATPCDNQNWHSPAYILEQQLPNKCISGLTWENSPRRLRVLELEGKRYYI